MSGVPREYSTIEVDISDWVTPSADKDRGETTEQGEEGGENVVWTARDSYPFGEDIKAQRGATRTRENRAVGGWKQETLKLNQRSNGALIKDA